MTTEGLKPSFPAMEGRMPLPDVLGSAPTVVGPNEPLRPDRSFWILRILSTALGVFGADHFYLRSPGTGLLKGITFGGFLVWWLWDVFQVWTEKNEVLLYGMSAPFDLKRGYGQGTIADDVGKSWSNYVQQSDSALWIFAALFSFVGLDAMLLGKWGQMLRKWTELIIFGILAWSLTRTWHENGIDGLATVGNAFKIILAIVFGFIIVVQWALVAVPSLTDPADMFKNGITVSKSKDQILNYPKAWINNIEVFNWIDPELKNRIISDIGYASMKPEDMRKAFEVKFMTKQERADKAAAEAAAPDDSSHWHWLMSYAVYLFGPLIWIFSLILQALSVPFPWIRTAISVGGKMAEGKSPVDAVAESVTSIPGVGTVLEAAKQAEETARAATNAVSAAKAAAAGITDSARSAVTGAIGGIELPSFKLPGLKQGGGARHEEPTGQGMVLGATVFALAGGAAIKLAVDYLLPSQ
jgi:TM2 domain-containing membrane protein YozV